jgi:adenylylsulfate kinase-like enzyme
MTKSAFHNSPLTNSRYLVIEFDHSNAHMAVHGDIGYSEGSREHAVRDASEAAQLAEEQGRSLTYVVVTVGQEVTFSNYRRP